MFNLFKKRLVIATHSGSFHADDLFACAALKLAYPNAKIVRTRDAAIIHAADIVLDVGGMYDPAQNRYDHHQKGGAGIRDNKIPYAAFGLIWKHFGMRLCKDDREVWNRIEQKIVLSQDAIDNGVAIVKDSFAGVMPYAADQAFLAFSPSWKENENTIDRIFIEQVEKAKMLLAREIKVAADDVEGERIILNAPRKDGIVMLDISMPRYLYQNLLARDESAYFVLLPQKNGGWKAECIRKNEFTMESRRPFPESWTGLEGEALQKESGVATATFCHKGRFLAGAKTKEDALLLAEKTLSA